MKIALPVSKNSLDAAVASSFGRTEWFMLYDTKTEKAEFLSNSASSLQGGAGIKASQSLVDGGVDIVISPRFGENARDVLAGAGIKAFKSAEGGALENIKLFLSGSLTPLEDAHPGLHNHGRR
ncbi:MAG: NifB/NifX family molybdenum-iron cluster-binding protein [Eubacteriales bacterium]